MLTTTLILALGLACSDKDGDDTGPGGDGGTADGGSADGGVGDGGTTDGGTADGGSSDGGSSTTDADSDGFTADEDCDDSDPAVNPDATEVYDGIDNDCNDVIDDMPAWGYSDHDGHIPPEDWGLYWPDCDGSEQSPVDIVPDAIEDIDPDELELGWDSSSIDVENNGHTVKWSVDEGSSVSYGGRTYELDQFHFHALSEHKLDGEHAPLEAHFVHVDDNKTADDSSDDAYLVLGLLFEEGAENRFLADIGWDSMPAAEGAEATGTDGSYDLFDAIPPDWVKLPTLLFYDGSFTTPPCTEGVQWLILGTYAQLSPAQLASFQALYTDNYRETQDLNGRTVGFGVLGD